MPNPDCDVCDGGGRLYGDEMRDGCRGPCSACERWDASRGETMERCPECGRMKFDPDDMPPGVAVCLSLRDRDCYSAGQAYRRGIVDALRWAADVLSDYTKVCRVVGGRIEQGGRVPWLPEETP
jgi:hypothetical protein